MKSLLSLEFDLLHVPFSVHASSPIACALQKAITSFDIISSTYVSLKSHSNSGCFFPDFINYVVLLTFHSSFTSVLSDCTWCVAKSLLSISWWNIWQSFELLRECCKPHPDCTICWMIMCWGIMRTHSVWDVQLCIFKMWNDWPGSCIFTYIHFIFLRFYQLNQ